MGKGGMQHRVAGGVLALLCLAALTEARSCGFYCSQSSDCDYTTCLAQCENCGCGADRFQCSQQGPDAVGTCNDCPSIGHGVVAAIVVLTLLFFSVCLVYWGCQHFRHTRGYRPLWTSGSSSSTAEGGMVYYDAGEQMHVPSSHAEYGNAMYHGAPLPNVHGPPDYSTVPPPPEYSAQDPLASPDA